MPGLSFCFSVSVLLSSSACGCDCAQGEECSGGGGRHREGDVIEGDIVGRAVAELADGDADGIEVGVGDDAKELEGEVN